MSGTEKVLGQMCQKLHGSQVSHMRCIWGVAYHFRWQGHCCMACGNLTGHIIGNQQTIRANSKYIDLLHASVRTQVLNAQVDSWEALGSSPGFDVMPDADVDCKGSTHSGPTCSHFRCCLHYWVLQIA